MSHFAKVENNIVTQVIVAERDVLDTGLWGDPNSWIQTSYNTRGNIHYNEFGEPDDGIPLRKNFAGIGYIYDNQRDAFYPPQPYPSWILNEDTCLWEPPIPRPQSTETTIYVWDEETCLWKLTSNTDIVS